MGESSKKAVYFHIEKSFSIKKEEIPRRIEDFARAIESIFGLGAHFLEIIIMKRLNQRIRSGFNWSESSDFTFAEYIVAAERNFMERENPEEPVQSNLVETQG